MRITVLGGTRFIGFALVEELVSAGHDVTVVHRGETEPADLPACAHVHLARDQLAGVPAVTGAEALIDMRAMTARDAQAVLDVVAEEIRLVVHLVGGCLPSLRRPPQGGGDRSGAAG